MIGDTITDLFFSKKPNLKFIHINQNKFYKEIEQLI